jgi:hypothetical protein
VNRSFRWQAVLFCSALALVLSCRFANLGRRDSGSGTGGNNSNANSTSSGGGFESTGNASADLSRAMRNQLGVKSFRAKMESTYRDRTSTRTLEYVAPDRYRMISDLDETIIVGSETFRRVKGGSWQKFPFDIGSIVKSFRDPKMAEEISKNTTVKFLGPDTLDGHPMFVYQYTLTKALGMDINSTSKVWVAASDGLARKAESDGEFNGAKSHTLITYSDYNSAISIDVPPVK